MNSRYFYVVVTRNEQQFGHGGYSHYFGALAKKKRLKDSLATDPYVEVEIHSPTHIQVTA